LNNVHCVWRYTWLCISESYQFGMFDNIMASEVFNTSHVSFTENKNKLADCSWIDKPGIGECWKSVLLVDQLYSLPSLGLNPEMKRGSGNCWRQYIWILTLSRAAVWSLGMAWMKGTRTIIDTVHFSVTFSSSTHWLSQFGIS
jgi:hypothetical protein